MKPRITKEKKAKIQHILDELAQGVSISDIGRCHEDVETIRKRRLLSRQPLGFRPPEVYLEPVATITTSQTSAEPGDSVDRISLMMPAFLTYRKESLKYLGAKREIKSFASSLLRFPSAILQLLLLSAHLPILRLNCYTIWKKNCNP